MKNDRELIELAKSQSLEAIAEKIQRSPATVLEKAARLGLSIKRKGRGNEGGEIARIGRYGDASLSHRSPDSPGSGSSRHP
jgi:hypothetical protein